MTLESRATFAKIPGQAVSDVPPPQSPDREEVVVVMAESREVCRQRFLLFQRDASGRFVGFGASPLPEFDNKQGRFAQLIPLKVPSEQNAAMARTVLQVMGVELIDRGPNPMWN